MKKLRPRLRLILILIVLIVIGLAAVLVYLSNRTKPQQDSVSFISCSAELESDFNCWKKRYETMVMAQSPKEAFTDVRAAYESTAYVKTNCHQIAHVIGRTASKKYSDISAAYNEGDNFCWSGYYHGVMEGVANSLGTDKLLAQLDTICDGTEQSGRYSFYHYNCVHGLGHGLMVVYENELFQSLDACDGLTDEWEQQSCYGGVYMENVMAEHNPDHTTKYLKRDQPLYPCTEVQEKYKHSCYMMQTSFALVALDQDYNKVFELCSTVGDYSAICYQSLGRDASGSTTSDPTRTRDLCMLGQHIEAQKNCVKGAVKDFISYHHDDKEALKFCDALIATLKTTCTETAVEYYKSF
jgi:hypothetical protein